MAIHPGVILAEDFVEPLGRTITDLAHELGVSRSGLSALLNGRRRISPQMALRLERVFGEPALDWLVAQAIYDLRGRGGSSTRNPVRGATEG